MTTVLVALEVDSHSFEHAQEAIMSDLLPQYPPTPEHPYIESWWIAEDERYDGSDNESAVFIPTEWPQSKVGEMFRYMQRNGLDPYGAITLMEHALAEEN